MKKPAITALVVLVVMGGSGVFGQTTKSVDITVTLTNWYYLNVGTTTLTFNDEAPTFQASPPTANILAYENDVAITAGGALPTTQTLHLYISATNLTVGLLTIPISAISWTAPTGAGFVGGILANSNVQAGSWTGGSVWHWHTGTLRFSFLRNYQTQSPGAYKSTATVTLSNV